MSGHLFIFRGIPGSGKSSIARAMLDAGLLDLVVTRDNIRQKLDPGHRFVDREKMTPEDRDFERKVVRVRDVHISDGLARGLRVASADTNISGTAMRELHALAEHCKVDVTVILIDTPVEECVDRDRLRERPVGESVIHRIASDWYWQRR